MREAAGERDLGKLLAELRPRLDERALRLLQPACGGARRRRRPGSGGRGGGGRGADGGGGGQAPEGAGLSFTGRFARITLQVHSSLDAVGLTAAVAGRLAERRISANVVAGFSHDHLFVPWQPREEAVEVLSRS